MVDIPCIDPMGLIYIYTYGIYKRLGERPGNVLLVHGSAKDELIWVSCSERVWRAARVLSTNANELSVELLGEDWFQKEQFSR